MEPENPYDPSSTPLLHAAWALGHQACLASLEGVLIDAGDYQALESFLAHKAPTILEAWHREVS